MNSLFEQTIVKQHHKNGPIILEDIGRKGIVPSNMHKILEKMDISKYGDYFGFVNIFEAPCIYVKMTIMTIWVMMLMTSRRWLEREQDDDLSL